MFSWTPLGVSSAAPQQCWTPLGVSSAAPQQFLALRASPPAPVPPVTEVPRIARCDRSGLGLA
eukprot:7419597-Pyramimonas_sp.AAC.1